MATTVMSGKTWTAATIDTALVRINTALARLRCRPGSSIDPSIAFAAEEARELQLHLELNPHDGTADALACCRRLLSEHPLS